MNKLLKTLIVALGCTASLLGQRVFSVSSYGLLPDHPELNASVYVRKIVQSVATTSGDSAVIIFPRGDYHFYQADASTKVVYISNHDQQTSARSIGILLDSVSNLSLKGEQGTNFYFHDRMLPFALINAKNIHIENIEVDFPNPQIAQVEIKENLQDKGIVFEPARWVKYRLERDQFINYDDNWFTPMRTGMAFRPASKDIVYRTADLGISFKGVEELGHRQIYAPNWKDQRLPAGTIVALRSYERPNPAFFVDGSKDISLSKVQVHYADGMGLLGQNSENIRLDGFDVCLRRELRGREGLPYSDPRYFTTQADATHFVACRGLIDVRNSLFENMMDDAINIHGVYLKVEERVDSRSIRASFQHHQAWGFEWAKAGEQVQFITAQTQELLEQPFTLERITPYGQKEVRGAKSFIIRFREKLPQSIQIERGLCVENISRTPNVNFVGNTIRNNRARGTLFNTAGDILVENNRFQSISGSAILVCSDATGWYESGRTRKLIIRKNLFQDVLTSLFQFTEAVITFSPNIPKLTEQKHPFYGDGKAGIVIEDNRFETFDIPILHAKSVDGIIFRNNSLKITDTYPQYHWNKEQFSFKHCTNLRIEPLILVH